MSFSWSVGNPQYRAGLTATRSNDQRTVSAPQLPMIPLLFALAAGPRPCLAFLPADTKEIPNCVSTDARGAMVVRPTALKQLAFDNGLSTISIDGGFFYVDRRGKTAHALPFDNGADPFVEGLART